MTTYPNDLSSVARKAANELEGRLPGGSYADGWADCASRLPSEEELAEAIAAGYDSVYAHRLPVNEHDLRAARAVRALIGEKISG